MLFRASGGGNRAATLYDAAAQRRVYRLKPEPLQEVDAWLGQFRLFGSAHVDALEHYLDNG